MPGTAKKFNADDGYNYNGSGQGNNIYLHPDSPSVMSQLTTATRRNEAVGDPDAPIDIQLEAPENLKEGSNLQIKFNDETYVIQIPPGGLKKGQLFETTIDPKQKCSSRNNHSFVSRGSSRRMQMDGQMDALEEESHIGSRSAGHSRGENSRRSGNSSSHYRQTHKARLYDDASEYTGQEDQNGEKNVDDMKQSHTYPVEDEEEENATEETIWYDSNGTPMGGWRTRLCSCCDVLTQSTFWMGFFCAPVLMAQLITRLKLTWNGREGTPEQAALSFNKLVLSLVFTMAAFWVPVMGNICLFVYYLFVIVYVGSHVRAYMRQRYKIPSTLPTRCGDRIDDVCMMLFCGCCSTIQMARHTHDDKDHPGHACTTTGLEFDAPEIV